MADFKVYDRVGIVEYCAAVNEMVEYFFDEDGNYEPQFGRINVVKVFFNYFVDGDSIKEYFADIDGEIEIDDIMNSDDCLELFNNELRKGGDYRLNFCNAYREAMEIVNQKKQGWENAARVIVRSVNEILDRISGELSEDKIEKFKKIVSEIREVNVTPEQIINAVTKK